MVTVALRVSGQPAAVCSLAPDRKLRMQTGRPIYRHYEGPAAASQPEPKRVLIRTEVVNSSLRDM